MKNLKLELSKAIEAYNNGSDEIKKFLVSAYGEDNFVTDIKLRVKDYESACKILGRDQLTLEQFKFLGDKESEKAFAKHKIETGIKAINEGWHPDFDDHNQYKYYIWMYGKSSGFRSDVYYCCHYSYEPSDLFIESREKAEVIEKIFREDYIKYLFG